MSARLFVLSAGAAQGAVTALAARHGLELAAEFGAVGAMQKKLLEGAPCDLIILTQALVAELGRTGRVLETADLGRVHTAIGVRAADPGPDVSTAEGLRAALASADEIYFPDPEKATAGIHFAGVLNKLGIKSEGRARTYPNGATAMREMARSQAPRVIGCTQLTEIRNTPGARVVAPLPAEVGLATLYSAGVCAGAAHRAAALEFLAALSSAQSLELRQAAGFEP